MPLVVLLAIAGLQGLAWATFTAPLQGPDEPAHAAYAQLIAETGHGPKRDSGKHEQSLHGFLLTRSGGRCRPE